MKSLGNLIKKKFSGKKNEKKNIELDEKTAFFIFKKVIQKEFGVLGSEKFLPQHFSNKTIFVKSISPAWSAELWMNAERVVKAINKELGEKLVEKIKVK